MNIRTILLNDCMMGLRPETIDDEIADALQEYFDEADHQGDPVPPADAITWMYDFAIYRKAVAP